MLAILTVNTNEDTWINTDGLLSLREAIEVVNRGSTAGLDPSTIQTQITGPLGTDDTIVFDESVFTPPSNHIEIDSAISFVDSDGIADIDISRSMIIDASSISGGVTIDGENFLIFDAISHDIDPDPAVFEARATILTIRALNLVNGGGGVTFDGLAREEGEEILDSLLIDECVITGNSGNGILTNEVIVTVQSSIISNNTSSNPDQGGGLSIHPPRPAGIVELDYTHALVVADSVISGNSGAIGGGISFLTHHEGTYENLDVQIVRSTITGNSTTGSGGGLYLDLGPGAYAEIHESTISANSASNGINPEGGGIYVILETSNGRNSESVRIDIVASTISGNLASERGGGLFVFSGDSDGSDTNFATVTLSNSTLSGNEVTNSVAGAGGGLHLYSLSTSDLQAELVNVTITKNRSAIGGGLYRLHEFGTPMDPSGTVRIDNTIISENTDLIELNPNPSNLVEETDTVPNVNISDSHNNLIGSGSNVLLDIVLGNIINEDEPLLGPLTNNSGRTLTHLPINNPGGEGTSPTIDAGSNAHAIDPFTEIALEVDQRGFDRIVDGDGNASEIVDIGAVEFQPGIDPPCNLLGDYNRDGSVDAADYVVWRKRLGAAITLPNEDPTVTPGMVTSEDFDVWRSHFGETCLMLGSAAVNTVATHSAEAKAIDDVFHALGTTYKTNRDDESGIVGLLPTSLESEIVERVRNGLTRPVQITVFEVSNDNDLLLAIADRDDMLKNGAVTNESENIRPDNFNATSVDTFDLDIDLALLSIMQ